MATVAAPAPVERRRLLSSKATVRALQVAGVVTFLVVWQIYGSLNPLSYSTPPRVLAETQALFFEHGLLRTAWSSLWTLSVGLVLAFAGGVGSGVLIGRYRVLRVMFDPYLAAFYSIPRVAFVPVMVIWFGIGGRFVIASVILAASIVLTFATAAGVRETALAFDEIADALNLSERQRFFKILLPGSVPFIASGLRIAIQKAVTAVIVAEFLIGVPGVGFVIRLARVNLMADRLFAMAILLMFVGMGLVAVTKAVENRFSAWRPQAF